MRKPSPVSIAGCAAAALGAVVGLSLPAVATDMPIKAPPKTIVQQTGGFYIWVDGSHQSVRLPTYDLGYKISTGPGFVNAGPAETHDPRATGYGVSGAIGWFLPAGTLWSAWGSNARIEVGGSYVDANDSRSQNGPLSNRFTVQLVSGIFAANIGCGPTCQTASTLNSDYAAWQVWGKATSDVRFGTTTVTPSIAVFGGHSRNEQDFRQQHFFPTVAAATGPSGTYTASSNLNWSDWGTKVGLDAKVDVTPWLSFGLGGNVGVAARSASLSANDHFFTTVLDFTSAISASATTTPFLANAEASVIVKPLPAVGVRGFVGLNYDSRVPGISAPTYVGPTFPANVTPAGIKFEAETSYYAGGGVTVKLGP